MKSCNYCMNDLSKEHIPVMDFDVDFGVLGSGRGSAYILSQRQPTLVLRINLDGCKQHDILASQEIQYCPMCGRDLEDK